MKIPKNPKIETIRICAVCYEPLKRFDKAANYQNGSRTYFFHPNCFNTLLDERKAPNFMKMSVIVSKFIEKGFEPVVKLEHHPKAHVTGFEPPQHKKLSDIEMIEEVLRFYNQPLSRKMIAIETGVPYTTVCWRIWENLDSQTEEPLFFIAKDRGPQGVELVGLIHYE